MNTEPATLDMALAKICEFCPVCLHARYHQKGMVFDFVKTVEQDICPFCKAYERVREKSPREKRRTMSAVTVVAKVAVSAKVRIIRIVSGNHDIDCKIDGIGAMQLKSEFVKKA